MHLLAKQYGVFICKDIYPALFIKREKFEKISNKYLIMGYLLRTPMSSMQCPRAPSTDVETAAATNRKVPRGSAQAAWLEYGLSRGLMSDPVQTGAFSVPRFPRLLSGDNNSAYLLTLVRL